MKLYFDTSALVKYFQPEIGSENVIELIDNKENDIYISELAIIEFHNTIYRRFREKQIIEADVEIILEIFDLTVNNYKIESITTEIMDNTKEIIKEVGKELGIRTLDSIHLSSFQMIAEKNWKFVVSDKQLANIAKELEIEVIFI